MVSFISYIFLKAAKQELERQRQQELERIRRQELFNQRNREQEEIIRLKSKKKSLQLELEALVRDSEHCNRSNFMFL